MGLAHVDLDVEDDNASEEPSAAAKLYKKVKHGMVNLTTNELVAVLASPRMYEIKQTGMSVLYHVFGWKKSMEDSIHRFGSLILHTARGRIICQTHTSNTCNCFLTPRRRFHIGLSPRRVVHCPSLNIRGTHTLKSKLDCGDTCAYRF